MSTVDRKKKRVSNPFYNSSLMSRPAMLEAIEKGDIVYLNGDLQDVKTASIDLRLGAWLWEETVLGGNQRIFNPHSREDVNRVWGRLWFAPRHCWWIREENIGNTLAGIDPDSRMFLIKPNTQMLCHTEEFLGGNSRNVTTMMKARSSSGRCFLEVCRCAGWGDHGYHTRWTMEMHNSSCTYQVPLVVGYRYAQMAFFRTRELERGETDYRLDGKYQSGDTSKIIVQRWTPEMMRPAMFRDREVPSSDKQRVFYRCDNADCRMEGTGLRTLKSFVLKTCPQCGSSVRVYDTPHVHDKVWPLYDICVQCGRIYNMWPQKSLAESLKFRQREEQECGFPLPCTSANCHGWRHILGGEYEVCNPDAPS
jgi:dCTP deaminase